MICIGLIVSCCAGSLFGITVDSESSFADGLNIPEPVEVSKDNIRRYQAYGDFTLSFIKSSKLKSSPCNDFYNYTCKHVNVFNYLGEMDKFNTRRLITGIYKSSEGRPKWFKFVKDQFDNCLNRDVGNSLHQNGRTLRKIFEKVNEDFGPTFPLFDQLDLAYDSTKLGQFVGYLSQKFSLHTFLAYRVEGSHLLLDEPRLAFPEGYFTEAFDQFEDEYKLSIKDYLFQLAEALDKQIDEVEMDRVVYEVVQFERTLAELFAQVEEEASVLVKPSQFTQTDQVIDVNAYLTQITKNAGDKNILLKNNIKIRLASPTKAEIVQVYLSQANPTTVLNYLNIRLARSLRKYYVRKPKECVADQWLREGRGVKTLGALPPIPKMDEYHTANTEEYCAKTLGYAYEGAIDRIYLDALLPDRKDRKEFVDRIKVITNKIITGFRFQIDQLSWLTPKVKEAAYKKIDAMLFHVVYDDWIENDDLLNKKYSNATDVKEDDDDFTFNQKLNDFAQSLKWNDLLDVDRNETFVVSIRTVNAWYSRYLNHFYIPLGILQPPIFDIDYPASLQYGSIGYVVGHELTHGFDSVGVLYDDQGYQNPWMDEPSKAKFNQMAQCVIDQYDKLHGRGEMTQTEDIADNGGLRAAFNAYKAEQGLYGSDPQLPGAPLNKLTHDQLFFIGFAHLFCSIEPDHDYPFDPHSSFHSRVKGTLQNFPAFQSAFNCPVGSNYAPKEHCDVWASEVKI